MQKNEGINSDRQYLRRNFLFVWIPTYVDTTYSKLKGYNTLPYPCLFQPQQSAPDHRHHPHTKKKENKTTKLRREQLQVLIIWSKRQHGKNRRDQGNVSLFKCRWTTSMVLSMVEGAIRRSVTNDWHRNQWRYVQGNTYSLDMFTILPSTISILALLLPEIYCKLAGLKKKEGSEVW